MDTGLKGKTVLITGASRNMGRLAALAFAREGANLALCTSAKMKELQQVGAGARALGAEGSAKAFQKPNPLRPTRRTPRMRKPQAMLSPMVYHPPEDAGFITGQCYLV